MSSDRQNHQRTPEHHNDVVEVWFQIEKDEDGYPESRSWEGLWCQPNEGAFEILSVPFYLKNVSRGDAIDALPREFLRFTEVVRRGGHNTYRLLMHEAAPGEIATAMHELTGKGLTAELNETGILIAVDVPPTVGQSEIDSYLVRHERGGRWQLQDGYLAHPLPAD